MSQAAANPYAAPAAQLAPGHRQCESCGADILVKAEICPKCGVRQRKPVSKAALLLLTFFFGGIGAHKFYLGKYWQGAFYLLFFWTYIPALIAIIEFFVYAFTSSDRLDEKYSAEGSPAVIVGVIVFFGIGVVGILAAIAIPAYSDYTNRAHVAESMAAVFPWRQAVEAHYVQNQKLPDGAADLGAASALPAGGRFGGVSLGTGGTLILTLAPNAGAVAGKTIVFQPDASAGGALRWGCTGGTLEPRYRPASCRPPR